MAKFTIYTKGTNQYQVEADDFSIVEGYFIFTASSMFTKVYAIDTGAVRRVERNDS